MDRHWKEINGSINRRMWISAYCNMIKIVTMLHKAELFRKTALENPADYGINDISLIQGSSEQRPTLYGNPIQGVNQRILFSTSTPG